MKSVLQDVFSSHLRNLYFDLDAVHNFPFFQVYPNALGNNFGFFHTKGFGNLIHLSPRRQPLTILLRRFIRAKLRKKSPFRPL